MCGICGEIHLNGALADAQVISRMNEMLFHRGPDQGDVIVDGPCGLGNRRLAILDLSPAGHLPMRSADNQISVAYNGEIYNFPELRSMLIAQGVQFRSHSDTEVILELFRREGAAAVQRLRGMFAFAAWDQANRHLLLARDRLGKKPLYYYHNEDVLVFASEIKALLRHPAVPVQSALDPMLTAVYLGYGYIPAPKTAFKDIYALMPGHVLEVRDRRVIITQYWEPPPMAGARLVQEHEIKTYAQAVRDLLDEAVRLRLISDVPLGAFLSGGLDSSLIAALMRKHSNAAVRTFSIGFTGDDSFDETVYARQVADYLQTEHTVFTVSPETTALVPKLVWHHDQPFADSSAIPTFLVSERTRQHVTVALTGDGGDELFAGYERFYAASLMETLGKVPRSVWKLAAGALDKIPESTGYYSKSKRLQRFARGASLPLVLAYFDWIRLFDVEMTRALINDSGMAEDVAGQDFMGLFSGKQASMHNLVEMNMRTYLPDDLLIKADRSSMAASLELRSPFLDHKLVELAATIPMNLKLNGKVTKYILKEAAQGLLPEKIIHRPKHGFGVPLGAWLRADITPVRDVLLDDRASRHDLFNRQAIETLITQHASGQRDHGQRLWTLLTFEWWHRLFIDVPVVARVHDF